MSFFLAADFFVLMVGCKEAGEEDVEGCGRLRVHDGLLDVAWFCVYTLGGSLAGDECKWGCGWWKYEFVGRQKGFWGSCLIRVTSMHSIKSIRMFEDDVT